MRQFAETLTMDIIDTMTTSERLISILVIATLVTISGCANLPVKTPTIEATPLPSFTATPTETPVPTPTEIPTPDPLDVDNYKIVEGNIQEKDREGNWKEITVPYEAGFISYVEVHEGKLYGIDTVDRAVVVRNEAGEWEKFERPINVVKDGYIDNLDNGYEIPAEFMEEVSPDKVTRFSKDGKPLPWGVVKEERYYGSEYSAAFEYISGYPLGAEYYKPYTQRWLALTFEIPLKYGRQIVVFSMYTGDYRDEMSSVELVPQSGNVEGMYRHSFLDSVLTGSFINQENRGKQTVIAIAINECDAPEIYNDECSREELREYMKNPQKFIDSIKEGEGVSVQFSAIPQRIWIDESFIPH